MGNRKARELMLQKEEDAQWLRVRTEVRPATCDVYARGIGLLRIQLIKSPSFEETRSWDVRNGPNGWTLYQSRGVPGHRELQLVGYDNIPFPPDKLATYFARLINLSLPIAPDLSG